MTAKMNVISRQMSHLTGQVKGDRLQGTDMMSLLSKSEIPSPRWPSLGTEVREAAAAAILLKRVRPSAWAELAEGPPAAGAGQERKAWGKLFNYYYIAILMNKDLPSAGGPPFFTPNVI
jgi:hypothetical protein